MLLVLYTVDYRSPSLVLTVSSTVMPIVETITNRREDLSLAICKLIRGSSSYPIIIGDFNCVLSAKDTENNFANKTCPALADLVKGFNYTDAFRIVKPDILEYTSHRPNCAASRLDRFYVP